MIKIDPVLEESLPKAHGNRQESDITQKGILSSQSLRHENHLFANTRGISALNRDQRFIPAFQDTRSGLSVISCFADGCPAPVHILDGLPDDWVGSRDANGSVLKAHAEIISGFLRDGRFYTRKEASQTPR